MTAVVRKEVPKRGGGPMIRGETIFDQRWSCPMSGAMRNGSHWPHVNRRSHPTLIHSRYDSSTFGACQAAATKSCALHTRLAPPYSGPGAHTPRVGAPASWCGAHIGGGARAVFGGRGGARPPPRETTL